MFRFLRGVWNSSEQGRGRNGRAGRGGARLQYERLESRQLLFAASLIEEVPDWQEPLRVEPIYARPVDVSLEVRPGGGRIGGGSGERWSLVPLPPTLPEDWLDAPQIPSEELPGGPPSAEYPDDPSLGGQIDIGGVGGTEQFGLDTPALPLAEGAPDREAQEVLALLQALQYIPRAEMALGEDTLDLLAADVAQLALKVTQGSELVARPTSDGGMVDLVRETLGAEKAGGLPAELELGEADALQQEERGRVEEIQGRYQAFEVSTTEVLPPRSFEGQLPVEAGSSAGVTARSNEGVAIAADLSGGLSIATSRDDSSVGSEKSRVSEAEHDPATASLVVPEPSEMTGSRVLREAAAVAFLLYTSRTARSADVKEPEKGRFGVPQ